MTGKRSVWTEEAVRALGVSTDVATAGSVLNMSRSAAYEAIRADRFPVPVVAVGSHLSVPTAPLLRLLQIGESEEAGPAAADPDQLADMVADRVVARLAEALTGTPRAGPLPGTDAAPPSRPLRRVAGGGPEAA